jgi:DNA-binding beta-propeller fold protein YncE/PKD repeat protein
VGYNVSSIVTNSTGTEFIASSGTAAHLILVSASTGAITPSFVPVTNIQTRLTLDPTNDLVYAWSGLNRTITTVNLTSNIVQQTSPDLGARAATLAYDPTSGHIFVADRMTDSIAVLNATTLTTARTPILLPAAPTSLVDDPQLSVIYAACTGSVVAISARSGAIMAENTALPGNNSQLTVDSASQLLWDVNGASGLLALEIPSLAAGPVAGITNGVALVRGVVLDPGTNDLFVVNTANSTVAVVNGSTGLEVGPAISGIPGVISVAYDSADQSVYALGRSISIIDPRTMAIVGTPITIAPTARAWSIIYDPSRHDLYVTSNGTPAPPWPGTVSVIDGSSIAASEDGSYAAISVGQLALDLLPVQLPGSVAPGSSEILVANFDSGTVSIIGSPPMIAYFAANPNPVDAGVGTDLLLGFAGGAGPSRISYTSLPPGCTSSDVTALGCTTEVAGSYRISVTVSSSFGLSSAAATVLSVSPSLHVGMNFGSPGAQVDLGHVLAVSATVSGGTGPFNYSWTFGDAGVAWGPYVGHTYSAAGDYLVTLTVLDAGGGVSSTTSSVSVVSLPVVSISASPSNVTDVNRSVGFSAAVSGGTTPGNASWTFGDGGTANGTVVDHAYSVSGVYFATVHYRDASGVNASQYTTVVVNPALAATLTVTNTPAPAPFAVGTPIDFATVISGGTAPYTIVWGFHDGSYGYGVSSSHTYGAAGTYSVTLFIEDAVGAQWNSTYRLVVTSASSSSSFGTDFQEGLILGLLVGAVAAAVILFWAGRSTKRRSRPSPPTAYVPPGPEDETGGAVPEPPWSER